jgi:hypothetical protein
MEEVDEEGGIHWKGYTKSAYGIPRNKIGYKVTIDRFDGFPIGVVMRAALINRFKSDRYPRAIDHTQELARWWRAYYRSVFEKR